MKLTQRRIEGLICPAGRKDKLVFDDEQKGLAVRVTASGGKTYLVQYSHAGKKRRVPLGTVDAISLAQARIAARAIMGDVAKGRDPATQRKEKALAAKCKKAHDALTVGKLVGDWEALHLVNKRPRYAFEATRAIRSVFKEYLDWPAAGLTRDRIVDTLDQLTKEGSPIMASRAGVYLGSAYQWAIDRGKLQINPCARLPRAAPTERDRVLTDPELRAMWAVAASAGDTRRAAASQRQPARLLRPRERRVQKLQQRQDRARSRVRNRGLGAARSPAHGRHQPAETGRAARSDRGLSEPRVGKPSWDRRRLPASHVGRRETRGAQRLGRARRRDRRRAHGGQ
jgi:hypothetical protein